MITPTRDPSAAIGQLPSLMQVAAIAAGVTNKRRLPQSRSSAATRADMGLPDRTWDARVPIRGLRRYC